MPVDRSCKGATRTEVWPRNVVIRDLESAKGRTCLGSTVVLLRERCSASAAKLREGATQFNATRIHSYAREAIPSAAGL